MRILMATTKLYPPQFYGGAEMSTHSMSLMLRDAGHDVAVLAGLGTKGLLSLRNRAIRKFRSGIEFPADDTEGYPVFRGWQPCLAVDEVIKKFNPDVLIAQSGEVVAVANAFTARGIPTCVFLRHSHYTKLGGVPDKLKSRAYVANSQHTARSYQTEFGLDCAVFIPTVIPDLYRTETDRSRVIYINPSPMKGIDLVLDLAARRPDIPFDVVESWTLPEWMVAEAKKRASKLPNVRWLRTKTDMRQVYRYAKVLLAPSGVGHPEWIEAWGRVVTEAQINGIPVLASNSGGLPESVGTGGIIIDTKAPFEDWLSALGELWDNPNSYATFSAAALDHADREEIKPKYQMDRFIHFLEDWLESLPVKETCR